MSRLVDPVAVLDVGDEPSRVGCGAPRFAERLPMEDPSRVKRNCGTAPPHTMSIPVFGVAAAEADPARRPVRPGFCPCVGFARTRERAAR